MIQKFKQRHLPFEPHKGTNLRKLLLKILRLTQFTSDFAACYGLWSSTSHLANKGWFKSFRRVSAVDLSGNPLPWFTYPSIDFLESRIHNSMKVFEFGSGQSTLWWSMRVSTVVSVEHDVNWFNQLKPALPQNVQYEYAALEDEQYSTYAKRADISFDIVVIDGRERVQCALNSVECLSPDGVIIWDNSNREDYQEGFDYLNSRGFKRIDFWGMCPITVLHTCTSVFYRQDNCLNI